MFLCGGGRALWSREAVVVRMASFESSGRRAMAASTSETISLTGIVRGVGANLGPSSMRERSAAESGFWDKLIVQFCLLIVVGWSSTASILGCWTCSHVSLQCCYGLKGTSFLGIVTVWMRCLWWLNLVTDVWFLRELPSEFEFGCGK